VEELDTRLEKLEKSVFVEEGYIPPELKTLKHRIEKFKTKLEVNICSESAFHWFFVRTNFRKIIPTLSLFFTGINFRE